MFSGWWSSGSRVHSNRCLKGSLPASGSRRRSSRGIHSTVARFNVLCVRRWQVRAAISSINVFNRHCRLVGLATACLVLQCQILCACGSTRAATDGSRAGGNVARAASCHGQQRHSEVPQAPEDDEDSCPHCTRLAFSETGKSSDELRPTELSVTFAPASLSIGPVDHLALRPRLMAGDLPPPRCGSTLLSQHCALNT